MGSERACKNGTMTCRLQKNQQPTSALNATALDHHHNTPCKRTNKHTLPHLRDLSAHWAAMQQLPMPLARLAALHCSLVSQTDGPHSPHGQM